MQDKTKSRVLEFQKLFGFALLLLFLPHGFVASALCAPYKYTHRERERKRQRDSQNPRDREERKGEIGNKTKIDTLKPRDRKRGIKLL